MASLLAQQPNEGGTYAFSSQPRVVPNRKKHKEQFAQDSDDAPGHGNLMYDRRVVRGNTYSQHVLPAVAQADLVEIQRQLEMGRRALVRKRALTRPKSPEAGEGRKRNGIQTEHYLEELADRIEEADIPCQTDDFIDRQPTPLFVPAQSGKDKETQILGNELLNFSVEVKPLLEVLVGRTVEQSLLEVGCEEELAGLRAQRRAFEELRGAELAEQQRLEERDRRHREETARRLLQQRQAQDKERQTASRTAALAFAQSYLAGLVPSVFGALAEHGYFHDPVERDLESGLLPWLLDSAGADLDSDGRARALLDGLLREVETKPRGERPADAINHARKKLPPSSASSVAAPGIADGEGECELGGGLGRRQ